MNEIKIDSWYSFLEMKYQIKEVFETYVSYKANEGEMISVPIEFFQKLVNEGTMKLIKE